MSRPAWERALSQAHLSSPSVRLVALALARHTDACGADARPGTDRLAAECGLHERTVRRALRELRALGLLQRTSSGSSAGRQALADAYRLAIPAHLAWRGPRDLAPAQRAGTLAGLLYSLDADLDPSSRLLLLALADHATAGALPSMTTLTRASSLPGPDVIARLHALEAAGLIRRRRQDSRPAVADLGAWDIVLPRHARVGGLSTPSPERPPGRRRREVKL